MAVFGYRRFHRRVHRTVIARLSHGYRNLIARLSHGYRNLIATSSQLCRSVMLFVAPPSASARAQRQPSASQPSASQPSASPARASSASAARAQRAARGAQRAAAPPGLHGRHNNWYIVDSKLRTFEKSNVLTVYSHHASAKEAMKLFVIVRGRTEVICDCSYCWEEPKLFVIIRTMRQPGSYEVICDCSMKNRSYL